MFLAIFVADAKIIFGYNFVAPLSDLCSMSTKTSVKQMFINKIWNTSLINLYLIHRSSFQNILQATVECYVTFLVADNSFSSNFKYFHGRISQNRFGSMNIKCFHGNGLSFKAYLLPIKIEFFIIAKEFSKSDFFLFFANGRRKVLYEVVAEVTG